MTDAPPPPGWYPDPAGSAAQRWWTGRDWAPVAAAAGAVGPPVVVQPALPAGTSTNTLWAFVQAALPLVAGLAQLPYLLSFQGYFAAVVASAQNGDTSDPSLAVGAFGSMLGAFALSSLLALLVVAAFVVLAFLDVRELRRRGIVQPFPWPWAFLSIVYPIGRAVVVRRRVSGSLAPLWVLIAAYVAGVALSFVVLFVVFGSLFTQIATLTSQLPTS